MRLKLFLFLFLPALLPAPCRAQGAGALLQRGWAALVQDDDTMALRCFGTASILAQQEKDTVHEAEAWLDMGIGYYSISYSQGVQYCLRAMDVYRSMERRYPQKAQEGRGRCLQLLSTIKSRQGQYDDAIALSKQALQCFEGVADTTGTVGLIYNSLGSAYEQSGMPDSSVYFHRMALAAHLRSNNTTYLPTALLQVAAIVLKQGDKDGSLQLYNRAQQIADSTGNRQAQVMALLGRGDWEWAVNKSEPAAAAYYNRASAIANGLTDRTFSRQAARRFLTLYTATGNYRQAMAYKDTVHAIGDSIASRDSRKELRALEIQYDIAEKDRQLQLVRKDREVAVLTNYMLWGGMALLLVLAGSVITVLRRINKRDRLLLQAKEELVQAGNRERQLLDEQQQLREAQLQQDLAHKESQLSAMTLQMLQKNEWMQELKDRLDESKTLEKDQKLNKIISKGMTQDKEWDDFNTYFESVNRHFYQRLKTAYPDISPNDLKLCALIRLQLSIKEMAAILNISPDSVKTARYRLRKKLQLNTEDNLTEFIMGL